jgi:hypothetical protein
MKSLKLKAMQHKTVECTELADPLGTTSGQRVEKHYSKDF